MSEINSVIHEAKKNLHRCHICDNEFDQYELELHFLSSHAEMDEGTIEDHNECDDIQGDPFTNVTFKTVHNLPSIEGPDLENDIITKSEYDDKMELQNVEIFESTVEQNNESYDINMEGIDLKNDLITEKESDEEKELQNDERFESKNDLISQKYVHSSRN